MINILLCDPSSILKVDKHYVYEARYKIKFLLFLKILSKSPQATSKELLETKSFEAKVAISELLFLTRKVNKITIEIPLTAMTEVDKSTRENCLSGIRT